MKHAKSFSHSITVFGTVIILAVALTSPTDSVAKKFSYPQGCREVNFNFKSDLLELDYNPAVETQDQTVYLVHNYSHHTIKLQVAFPQKYLPTYEKIIPSNSWGAIAKDKAPVQLACSSHDNEVEGYTLNCSETVELCNYNNAKFPPQKTGTYWLDRTGDLEFIKHYAIRAGILLRW